MPPAGTQLTINEYDALYGGEPGWEYWFGEARRKPVPTKLHGVLEESNEKYITQPQGLVVFEVLSEGDDIPTKCRHYSEINIEQVFVFDVDAKTITFWDGEELRPVVDVKLGNGVVITGATIWSEFSRRQQRQSPVSTII